MARETCSGSPSSTKVLICQGSVAVWLGESELRYGIMITTHNRTHARVSLRGVGVTKRSSQRRSMRDSQSEKARE